MKRIGIKTALGDGNPTLFKAEKAFSQSPRPLLSSNGGTSVGALSLSTEVKASSTSPTTKYVAWKEGETQGTEIAAQGTSSAWPSELTGKYDVSAMVFDGIFGEAGYPYASPPGTVQGGSAGMPLSFSTPLTGGFYDGEFIPAPDDPIFAPEGAPEGVSEYLAGAPPVAPEYPTASVPAGSDTPLDLPTEAPVGTPADPPVDSAENPNLTPPVDEENGGNIDPPEGGGEDRPDDGGEYGDPPDDNGEDGEYDPPVDNGEYGDPPVDNGEYGDPPDDGGEDDDPPDDYGTDDGTDDAGNDYT